MARCMWRTTRMVRSLLTGLGLFVLTSMAHNQGEAHGVVGSTAPTLLLEQLSGESVRFPDRGRIDQPLTAVVFWASWSEFSARELQRIKVLYPEWSAHGVTVVAVNVEAHKIGPTERGVVSAFLEREVLPFRVVLDRGLKAFHAYGVVAVPTTLLLDSAGTVVFRLPGYPAGGAERFEDYVERAVIDSGMEARGEVPERSESQRRALRYTRLGRLLIERAEFEFAEFTLKKGRREDPRLLDARLALAELYTDTSREEQAEFVLREAIVDFPNNSRALLALASLKWHAQELTACEELALRALGLNPSLSGAALLLARVRSASLDLQGALQLLDQAVEINPLDLDLTIELGRVHEALANKARAIECYERAYSLLDPSWHP